MANKNTNSFNYSLLSEFLFTILPLTIIVIIRSYEEDYNKIFFNSEWAVISIILFGQSIVKLASGIANYNNKLTWQKVSFIISILIIIGLIPSTTILVLNVLDQQNSTPNLVLHTLQIFFFFLSCIAFFIIGAVGQSFLEDE
ncbi:hypothetical protein EI427_12845 [Flammeovirga pectinis]|uniref:Uncharacterized protein n=1 Tax=Flammeovirga pectinis TaxID=2494373 RepID=A0A3Q9FRI6_9BACT|nr:hypothetical protein [Flammeovirga pectinis]AZQ63092.1 hypothetical protein EI427_12845 [Flammeovirga pectinis]